MKFNEHSSLLGQHAFLGASNYHWLNYDIAKLTDRYLKQQAVIRGTELHDFACRAIRLGIKMPRTRHTLNQYVNDAIGYRMTPEQVLYYSPNCFGTADTIAFDHNFLRIHDLKTGEIEASMRQLDIYAALFCLEYRIKPEGMDGVELRIYQNDEIKISEPKPEDISFVMEKIVLFDREIGKLKTEE